MYHQGNRELQERFGSQALADRLMELRWIARKRDTRALSITPIGWGKIEHTFGCSLHDHTVHERSALRVVAG